MTMPLSQKWRDAFRNLVTVLVGSERVQRMSRQRMLLQAPAPAGVHDGDDRPVGVIFDRNGTGVAVASIDEVRERHDPFVAKVAWPLDSHHPREIALLRPELGRMCKLGEQVRNDFLHFEPPPFTPDPEMCLRDVLREDARVVTKAIDGSRATRCSVLVQAG